MSFTSVILYFSSVISLFLFISPLSLLRSPILPLVSRESVFEAFFDGGLKTLVR